MRWMLQPHNWTQAMRPNLYSVDYRRVGAYKGMGGLSGFGQMGPPITCPTGEQVFRSADCPGGVPPSAAAGDALAQMQAEIDALFGYTRAGQAPAAPATNWTPWLIIGGGLLLVMMLSRR